MEMILNNSYHANNAKLVNISCSDGYCNNLFVHAQSAQNLIVNCDNAQNIFGGCSSFTIDGNTVSSLIQLFCIGYNACNGGQLIATDAKQLNITMNSSRIMNDALNAPVIVTLLHDYGTNLLPNYGCKNMIFKTIEGLQDINVLWDGDCKLIQSELY